MTRKAKGWRKHIRRELAKEKRNDLQRFNPVITVSGNMRCYNYGDKTLSLLDY